jgi:hypothetical protein
MRNVLYHIAEVVCNLVQAILVSIDFVYVVTETVPGYLLTSPCK